MDAVDICEAIENGDVDESLELIQQAIAERKPVINMMTFARLHVGDQVRIKNARPKYLNGATAEVVEKRTTKVTILFPMEMDFKHDPYEKFAGRRWIFPVSTLEKVAS